MAAWRANGTPAGGVASTSTVVKQPSATVGSAEAGTRDYLICEVLVNGTGTPTMTGWENLGEGSMTGSEAARLVWFGRYATESGEKSFTISFSASLYNACHITAFKEPHPTEAVIKAKDVVVKAISVATKEMKVTTITPEVSGCVSYISVGINQTGACEPPTNWTERQDNTIGDYVCTRDSVPKEATGEQTIKCAGTRTYVSVQILVRPSADTRIEAPAAGATASAAAPVPTVSIVAAAGSSTASASGPMPSVRAVPAAASATASSQGPVPSLNVGASAASASANSPAPVPQVAPGPPPASASAGAVSPAPTVLVIGSPASSTAGGSVPVPAIRVGAPAASATASASAPTITTAHVGAPLTDMPTTLALSDPGAVLSLSSPSYSLRLGDPGASLAIDPNAHLLGLSDPGAQLATSDPAATLALDDHETELKLDG